jgi:hypothetical protein
MEVFRNLDTGDIIIYIYTKLFTPPRATTSMLSAFMNRFRRRSPRPLSPEENV